VPHAVLLLPQIRRAAAAVLIALAVSLTLAASGAFATEGTTTGGTTAAATPAKPKVKKVSTKRIQKALGIKADGAFGPKTKRAVKTYQRRNGLKVTGRADTATLRSLGLIGQPQASALDAAPAPIPADAKAILDQLAQCESGGNVAAESRDGRYFGKYQFSIATWEAMGGTGSPAEAAEATQDALAFKLYQQRGTAPWPSCSAQLDLEDA
jgi:peptidoglycan hydrolase-like protein with peptidoglycan-binding domain